MPQEDQFIDPSREQFDAFKNLERDRPIYMLNLLRFRKLASYPDTHPSAGTGLSGEQAYVLYGQESGPVFQRLGGEIVWRGAFETTLIGPREEYWDSIFIARYPDAHAFLAMVSDPEYQKAVVHRQSAVATSRLVRMDSLPVDSGFAQ